MLALNDLQLVLNAALPEDGALEEGDEARQGGLEVDGRDVEVEVGVLGGRVRVGAAATVA